MTVDEAISAIKGQLGNWTGTNIDLWCINEMNAAVRRLERSPVLPWFLEEDNQFMSCLAGEDKVFLPPDFLREDDETLASPFMVWVSGTWKPLQKMELSDIIEKYPDTQTGIPRVYALRQSVVHIRPIASEDLTFRLLYFKRTEPITASSSFPIWLFNRPDLVVAEAGRVIAGQYLKDEKAAMYFLSRVKEERAWLDTEIVARQEAGRRWIKGE